jgi:aminoglycoside phosphotransferase (APT) family kinase protein
VTGPSLLASGRDADVYALDDRRVLRRYRNGLDATAEAAVMRHVGALGYPVPRVHSVDHTEMVLERLDGPTLFEAMAVEQLTLADGARMLADLQTRLHALPPLSADPALDLRVLHRDLHPGNVMLPPSGPVVIDWSTATEGSPDLDVALSAVVVAQAAVDGIDNMHSGVTELAREFLVAFIAHSARTPRTMLAEALATLRANPTLSATETARLGDAAALVDSLSGDV